MLQCHNNILIFYFLDITVFMLQTLPHSCGELIGQTKCCFFVDIFFSCGWLCNVISWWLSSSEFFELGSSVIDGWPCSQLPSCQFAPVMASGPIHRRS